MMLLNNKPLDRDRTSNLWTTKKQAREELENIPHNKSLGSRARSLWETSHLIVTIKCLMAQKHCFLHQNRS